MIVLLIDYKVIKNQNQSNALAGRDTMADNSEVQASLCSSATGMKSILGFSAGMKFRKNAIFVKCQVKYQRIAYPKRRN